MLTEQKREMLSKTVVRSTEEDWPEERQRRLLSFVLSLGADSEEDAEAGLSAMGWLVSKGKEQISLDCQEYLQQIIAGKDEYMDWYRVAAASILAFQLNFLRGPERRKKLGAFLIKWCFGPEWAPPFGQGGYHPDYGGIKVRSLMPPFTADPTIARNMEPFTRKEYGREFRRD